MMKDEFSRSRLECYVNSPLATGVEVSVESSCWHSAHVYYYEDDKDGLLLDAVRPLFADLTGIVTRAYFVRHWRQGPHLRLNIEAAPEVWTTQVRPLVENRFAVYLRDHPSLAQLSEDRELRRHRLLAKMEREIGPLIPWKPDNSLWFAPYDWRLHVLRRVRAAQLLAAFYNDTTPMAFAILARARTRGDRAGTCLSLMFALAHTMCPPITRGFISFRSHAEGFLANCGDPLQVRTMFDKQYAANRDTLREVLHAVLSMLDDSGERLPFVEEWVALLGRYRGEIERLLDAGEITLDLSSNDENADVQLSSFQRLLQETNVWPEISQARWFRAYRILLNYTYLHMNRLGITPLQRYTLCHLAANIVEDTFDVSADEQIRDPAL